MLDFQKLFPQIASLSAEDERDLESERKILSLAQTSYEEAADHGLQLEELLKKNGGTTFWPCALPLESFGKSLSLAPYGDSHTVVACDGSQIMPTQHEIQSCYVLNVGAALIHYGEKSRALLSSYPHLYYRQEDLYPLLAQRRIHIDESLVSFERGLKELQQARELALAESEAGNRVLILVDGSLLPFNLDRNADRLQEELLIRFGMELDAFNALKIPVLGYISHSRSSDLVNILRVWRCPYPEVRCQLNCGNINEEDFPCSEIWPLSDRQLMASKLPSEARSGIFLSTARWSLALKQRNQICFAYLNCGVEAARVEMPYWMFEDRELLDFAFSVLVQQIRRGQGYPVSLQEAHNMAVIRQADRSRFFQLVAQELVKRKKTRVAVSPKESKKRRGFV